MELYFDSDNSLIVFCQLDNGEKEFLNFIFDLFADLFEDMYESDEIDNKKLIELYTIIDRINDDKFFYVIDDCYLSDKEETETVIKLMLKVFEGSSNKVNENYKKENEILIDFCESTLKWLNSFNKNKE